MQSKELGRNTVGTISGDTFYLWNNAGEDVFWDTISADDFEVVARQNLFNCLSANSTGDVSNLINGYLSHLRRFKKGKLAMAHPICHKAFKNKR